MAWPYDEEESLFDRIKRAHTQQSGSPGGATLTVAEDEPLIDRIRRAYQNQSASADVEGKARETGDYLKVTPESASPVERHVYDPKTGLPQGAPIDFNEGLAARGAAGILPSAVSMLSRFLIGNEQPVQEGPANPQMMELARGVAGGVPEVPGATAANELLNRAGGAISYSPEEEAESPYSLFIGQLVGSLPLAAIGPQFSIETIAGTSAFKQLASRVGTRAAMAAAENLPQVVAQNMSPDMDMSTFATNVGKQLGTIALAGGALEGVAAMRGPKAEAPATSREGRFGQNIPGPRADLEVERLEREIGGREQIAVPHNLEELIPRTYVEEGKYSGSPEDAQLANEIIEKYVAATGDTPTGKTIKDSMAPPIEVRADDPTIDSSFFRPGRNNRNDMISMSKKAPGEDVLAHELGHRAVSKMPDAGIMSDTSTLNSFHHATASIRAWKEAERYGHSQAAEHLKKSALYQIENFMAKDEGMAMELLHAFMPEPYRQGTEFARYSNKRSSAPHGSQEFLADGLARWLLHPEGLKPEVRANVDRILKGSSSEPVFKQSETPGFRSSGESELNSQVAGVSKQPPGGEGFEGFIGGGMPSRDIPSGPIPKTVAGEHVIPKSNIRLDKFEDADAATEKAVRQQIEDTASTHGVDVVKARRGTISVDETEKQAQLMGADPVQLKRILSQENNVALNEVEIRAIGNVLHSASKHLADVSEKYAAGELGQNELRNAVMMQHSAQMRAHAAWATAGRALRNLRDPIKGLQLENFEKLMTVLDDPELSKQFAGQVSQAYKQGVPAGNAFLKNSSKVNFWDKLFEYRVGSMLYLGYGQLRNAVSNAAQTAKMAEERFTAVPIERVRSMLAGEKPQLSTRGAVENFKGMATGLREGAIRFKDTMKTEQSAFGKMVRSKGTPYQAASKTPNVKAIGGKLGRVVRLGANVMEATDDFNKSVLYAGHISDLAFERARLEGRANDAVYIKNLVNNPPPEMVDKAAHYANVGTFTDRDAALTKWALRFRSTPGMRWIATFVPTNTNILRQAAARLPFAGFGVSAADAVRGVRGAELSKSIARPVLPTAMSIILADMVMDGTITGGRPTPESSSKAKDQYARAAGWQPYSVRVGDRYVSIKSFSPQANWLMASADLALAMQADDKQAIDIATKHLQNNFARESMLGDVNEAFSILLDSQNYPDAGRTYAGQFASSFIPANATVRAISQATDDTDRETRGFTGQVYSTIPGARQTLPAKEDQFGREMKGRTGSGFLRTSNINNDELETLLRAEKMAGYKRSMPGTNETRLEQLKEDPKELMDRFAKARAFIQDEPRTRRKEKKHLAEEDRAPENLERKELYQLKDRLYKGELHSAVLAGDKERFMRVWKEAKRAGFNIASGKPRDFWRARLQENEDE